MYNSNNKNSNINNNNNNNNHNNHNKHEKLTKYRQLAFELRERRLGYDVTIVPIVIDALGGGIKQVLCDVERVFSECTEKERLVKATVAEMQKTVLLDS